MAYRRPARAFALFDNLPLNAKGLLVMAIPVAALLAAMAVLYQSERRSGQAEGALLHAFEVRSEARQVLTELLNAETGMRGYLLTRREHFLGPYSAARGDLGRHLDTLRRLVAGDPAAAERAARVGTLTAGLLAEMDGMGPRGAAGTGAAAMEALERAKAQMDGLRAELAALIESEQRELAAKMNVAQESRQRLEATVFFGGMTGLLGGLIAGLIFTRSVGRRVRGLEEDARRVAQGLPVEMEVHGGDELARFQRTLKETAYKLARQSEELHAVHDELEMRVERRTAELLTTSEELRRAINVSQTIIGATPLAMWAMDLEGKVTFWNPAAERIFGWTEAEAIGQPLRVVPPEQQAEFQEWLERFRNGEKVVEMERQRQKKDGTLLTVMIWTAPLRDANGAITGTLAIDSDVTARKSLEEQFRQSQKLEAVGRLAGGVSHDFNNLLTVIIGYVEMLLVEAEGSPTVVEYAQEIQEAAGRAGALTAQLLAFSRRQVSQPRVLDLNDMVARSTRMLSRVIGEDVEIATHLDAGVGRVKVDPGHIDQVLMNLVVNARDAMPDGGKLTIETAAVALDEEYVGRHLGVVPGTYCMLAVSDTGVGMSAEVKSRLFEPFFTTKEAGKGTGLGLAIVYGIVKQSGGEIMVYSEPGHGTTFKIYLPSVEGAAEAAKAEPVLASLRGSERILLCEDEAEIRSLVRTLLERQGYQVMEAETPARAMEMARERSGSLDMLLTDVVMPETSGFELARRLREAQPDLKVLFMSGYTDRRVSGGWVVDEDTPFLQKPFTAKALALKVRETLAR